MFVGTPASRRRALNRTYNPPSMSRRFALIAVFALFALAWLTPLRRELFVGDETKYSGVVREMRASGSWFLPPLEGTPFTHKPPLHFWLLAADSLLFGTHSIWT